MRPDWLMGIVLASMGFGNFWVYAVNSMWSPVKLTSIIALGYVIFLSRNSLFGLNSTARILFCGICIWASISCITGLVLPLQGGAGEGGGFQSRLLRSPVQLLGYGAALSLFPLGLVAARQKGGLETVLNIFNLAVVVVLFFSVLQIIFLTLGLAFLPIYRPFGGGVHSDVAAFSFHGEVIFRLYATAGEPKTLGIFLAPHAVMGAVLFFRPRHEAPYWWNRRSLFALSSIVCVLTFSTAVLIALALAWTCAIVLSVRKDVLIAVSLGVAFVASLLVLADAYFDFLSLDSRIGNMIYARTVQRLEADIDERLETMALDLLLANPANLVVGFGLGMFVFHLPGLVFSMGIEPIDSGWITLMMDMGTVGVGLLACFLLVVVQSLFNGRGGGLKVGLVSCALACGFLHLGTAAFPGVMLWSGLALSMCWRSPSVA